MNRLSSRSLNTLGCASLLLLLVCCQFSVTVQLTPEPGATSEQTVTDPEAVTPEPTTTDPDSTTSEQTTTIATDKSTTSELTTTTTALESTTSELTTTTTALESTTSELTTTTTALESTTSELTTTTTALESTTSELTTTTAASESTTSELKTTVAALESTTSELTTTTAASESTTSELKFTIAALESTTSELTTTIAASESTTPELTTTTAASESTTPELTTTTVASESTTSELTTTTVPGSTTNTQSTASPQSSASPTHNTTIEPTTSTIGNSTSTSWPVTTARTTLTTARPTKPPNAIPPSYENIKYDLTSSIGFNGTGQEDLGNSSSTLYTQCLREAVSVVNNAYFGCPGYERCTVTTISWKDVTNATATISTFNAVEGPFVVVNYTAIFSGDVFLSSTSAEILSYINETVAGNLVKSSILGIALDEDYIHTAVNETIVTQGSTWNKGACTKNPKACEQCNSCEESTSNNVGVYCAPKCTASHEYCQVLSANTDTCSCEPNYLPVAGDCVHQNWIIGLSAGIGGAILVGLVIAVIVLSCSNGTSSSGASTSSKDRLYTNEPAVFSGIDNAATGQDDINLAEIGGANSSNEQPYSTFGRTVADVTATDSTISLSPEQQRHNEELAAQAAEQRQLIEQQEQQMQQLADQLRKQQEQMELLQQQQQEQQQQQQKQQQVASAAPANYGGQPSSGAQSSYEQLTAQQPASYSSTFVPQLQNVDPYTNYAIKRPKTVGPPTAPRPQYPTSAYSPDFF